MLFGKNKSEKVSKLEKKEAPGKVGDRVLCYIDGQHIKGTIYNNDISGGNLIGILLDEKMKGGKYFQGRGVTIGYELLKDPKKIEKIGEANKNELELMEITLKELKTLDMAEFHANKNPW